MEFSFKSITLITAVILTGLSAGLFYAWSVSIIPGTRKVIDITYLETMQSINKAILNPAFYLIFIGSLVLLILAAIQQYNIRPAFWFLLAAALTYLFGTFGVTAFGNVPLNDTLEAMNLGELIESERQQFRVFYEEKWNQFHTIRTIFAVLSFLFSVLALFSYSNE